MPRLSPIPSSARLAIVVLPEPTGPDTMLRNLPVQKPLAQVRQLSVQDFLDLADRGKLPLRHSTTEQADLIEQTQFDVRQQPHTLRVHVTGHEDPAQPQHLPRLVELLFV